MIPTYSEKYKVAQKIVSTSALLDASHAWIEDVLWVGFENTLIETTEDVTQTARFCRRIKGLLVPLKK